MMYLASLEEEMKDKVSGYTFIHTKEELDCVVTNNSVANTVVIRGDFASKYFTPSGLNDYVANVKKLNPNINIDYDTSVLTDVTYDNIIKKMSRCRSVEELIQILVTYRKEVFDTIRRLIKSANANKRQMLEYSNQISKLQSIINSYEQEVTDLKIALSQEQENKLQAQVRLSALINRINYQYNVGVDKTKQFVLKGNEFDRVLYFKEISRVQYTDTFIYYLKEVLRVAYSMPTRLVVVESFYATGKVRQYPKLKPHHNLVEEDVLSGDILMLGVQPKLMEDILRNPSHISILIVLDRAGYETPHILGDNVEYFYLASDLRDVPKSIPKSRVISYSQDTMFIKYIKDFNKLDHSQRISEYSSSKLMKSIFKLIEK